jgi:excisionase family DNA binding protein
MGQDPPMIDLLRPKEAAAIFGVTVATLARWARAGEVPFVPTLGGQRRYRLADVRALLGKAHD